ncbi:MAG: TrkA family potassium uptake protein, partial [Syntrophaceae bacterium]|nr:TrkA family potassium uptake protein [Syntrophaceae bacterium]
CVYGMGQFGSEIARELAHRCEVLALDNNEDRVNAIADSVQRAMIVDARDFAGLSSLVRDDFDEAIVSLGESMEASVLCTLHLKKIGLNTIRAKAVSEDHASILRAVGASETIFPERETARRVAAQIVNPNLLDFVPLGEDFEVMDVGVPDAFIGKSLLNLKLRERFGVFVIAVKELIPPKFVFLPGPDFVIKPSDVLVMIGKEADLVRIQQSTAD